MFWNQYSGRHAWKCKTSKWLWWMPERNVVQTVYIGHSLTTLIINSSFFYWQHNLDMKYEHNLDMKYEHNLDMKYEHNLDMKYEHNLDMKYEHNLDTKYEHNLDMNTSWIWNMNTSWIWNMNTTWIWNAEHILDMKCWSSIKKIIWETNFVNDYLFV